VNRGTARRRLRLRRKRKGEVFASRLSDRSNAAAKVRDSGRGADVGDVVEVVGEAGGCVLEAVVSASVLLALLSVPAYLLLR